MQSACRRGQLRKPGGIREGKEAMLTSCQNSLTHPLCSASGSFICCCIRSSPSIPALRFRARTTSSHKGSPSKRHLLDQRFYMRYGEGSRMEEQVEHEEAAYGSSSAGFRQSCAPSARDGRACTDAQTERKRNRARMEDPPRPISARMNPAGSPYRRCRHRRDRQVAILVSDRTC